MINEKVYRFRKYFYCNEKVVEKHFVQFNIYPIKIMPRIDNIFNCMQSIKQTPVYFTFLSFYLQTFICNANANQ